LSSPEPKEASGVDGVPSRPKKRIVLAVSIDEKECRRMLSIIDIRILWQIMPSER
jgi:hypothetical protein